MRVIRGGHVLIGVAIPVFAGLLIHASQQPGAELETALIVPGLILIPIAGAFLFAAVRAWRQGSGETGRQVSRVLSVIELLIGLALFWAMAVAITGYGTFQPWRSPLLVPSLLLIVLGLAGVAERRASRAHSTA